MSEDAPHYSPIDSSHDSRCKGCGKRIVWAVTSTGARIPLDAEAPTYIVARDPSGEPKAVRHTAMVSHFSTCPKADRFSGGKKS